MNQIPAKKTNAKTIDQLFSKETEKVLDALRFIRENGNIQYLPSLFELLAGTKNHLISEHIVSLFSGVKEAESVKFFVDALNNGTYRHIRKTILTSCWQSRLPFQNYLPLFVKIMMEEDWETAFEAFTVIENFEFLPDTQIIKESLELLRNGQKGVNEQNQYLLNEAAVIIEGYSKLD